MPQVTGLLPKWIYTTTLIKLFSTLLYTLSLYLSPQKLNFNYFYIIYFIVILLRLIFVKKICKPLFFWFITISFVVDIVINMVERYFFGIRLYKTLCEIVFGIVSIVWMIFLHPYYLMNEKIINKKNK